jgi:translation initiation factor IF-3
VIGIDGEQLGVMTPEEARGRAEEAGYDLVEVAPNSRPPVCRIMDYGKYKYEQKKKAQAGKSKGKGRAASLKEIKMRPNTDDHDLSFKLKNARKFLVEGDKVKVTVMYRGREMAHRRVGYAKLDRVEELLGDLVTVENPPQMSGRFLSMILVPNREAVEAYRREEAAREGAAGEGGDEDERTQPEAPAEGEQTKAVVGAVGEESTPDEPAEPIAEQRTASAEAASAGED